MRGTWLGLIVLALAGGAGCGDDDGGPEVDASTTLDATTSDGGEDANPLLDAGESPLDGGGEPGAGCEGATLRDLPELPEARGPWEVGARTVRVGRLTAEVWYPAAPGSTGEAVRYDLRQWLPPSELRSIPDDDNPWQDCDCQRDLPIDEAHGPYPVVVFAHGTAAFRTQSLSILTHWASRGFVVVAADHPGLFLGDQLALACPDEASGMRNVPSDVRALVDALDAPTGELEFLAGRIDRARLGLAGHSAGGAVTGLAESTRAQVVIGLSSSQPASASPTLRASLFLGAEEDAVVRYSQTVGAYDRSPEPKWLLGIAGSGHLAPSDLCDLENSEGQDLVEVAQEHGVCGAMFASFLFDCQDSHIDPEDARIITRAITTAVLEQTLHCRDNAAVIAAIPDRFESVSELRP
jgi:predicted dienelactone hydrolase